MTQYIIGEERAPARLLRTALTAMYPLHLDGEGEPAGNGAAAPAAPAAPPAERSNDSQPGLRDAPGPLQKALSDFRAAHNAGEIALVPPGGAQTPAAPVVPVPDPAAAAPAAEVTAPAADLAAAVAGDPVAEAEAVVDPDAPVVGEETVDPLMLVELPARRGQDPIRIVAEDQATADALRNLRNLAGRAEVAEASAREARQNAAEYEAFEQLLELDPVGTVVDRMKPAHRLAAARQLLALPGVLEAVVDDIERWQGNPESRRADAADHRNERTDTRDRVRSKVAERNGQREVVEAITGTVVQLAELVPADLTQQFHDDCLTDISAFIRANNIRGHVAPELYPRILANRFRLYGVPPETALAALGSDARTSHPSTRPRPKGPAATALAAAPAAQRAQATGQQFQQASRVRRAVATSVPVPGAAVTVPAGQKPPKGSGVKGTIDWLRSRIPGGAR